MFEKSKMCKIEHAKNKYEKTKLLQRRGSEAKFWIALT
jgi:hypothetical protein